MGEGRLWPSWFIVLGGCQRHPPGSGEAWGTSQGSPTLALLPTSSPAVASCSRHTLYHHRCVASWQKINLFKQFILASLIYALFLKSHNCIASWSWCKIIGNNWKRWNVRFCCIVNIALDTRLKVRKRLIVVLMLQVCSLSLGMAWCCGCSLPPGVCVQAPISSPSTWPSLTSSWCLLSSLF